MAEDQRDNQMAVHDTVARLRLDDVAAEQQRSTVPTNERDNDMAEVIDHAALYGNASELRRLLAEGADPNVGLPESKPPLWTAITSSRPECIRLLIEAGANVDFTVDEIAIMYTMFKLVFALRTENFYVEGDCILAMDILTDASNRLIMAQNDLTREDNDEMKLSRKTLIGSLLWHELEEGSRKKRERDGLVALFSRQYWKEYDGRNPFLRASTAEEMMRLLIHGAANNENGHVDMTRLRSIKPSLRRNVMGLLNDHLDWHKTFIGFLVAVAKSDGGVPLCVLGGHESDILPLVADCLGVRGRALRNAREALDMLNELATGEGVEWEYNARAGDW